MMAKIGKTLGGMLLAFVLLLIGLTGLALIVAGFFLPQPLGIGGIFVGCMAVYVASRPRKKRK